MKINNKETSSDLNENITELLLEVLNPDRLSIQKFDIEDFFDSFLNSINKKFEYPLIVLRYEDENDQEKLPCLACYGFDKDDINKNTEVKKDSKLAKLLADSKVPKYFDDLSKKDIPYEQVEYFVEKRELQSLLACPIFLRKEFVGFIVYFNERKSGFGQNEIDFLGGPINNVIQQMLLFAESFYTFSNLYFNLQREFSTMLSNYSISFHDAKAIFEDIPDDVGFAIEEIEKLQSISEEEKDEILFWLKSAKKNSTHALNTILNSLKIQSQYTVISDLLKLIRNAVKPLNFKLHNVDVNILYSEKRPISIQGNEKLLSHVFFNIFHNSYQAIKQAIDENLIKKGSIIVSVHENLSEGKVYISIADNGIGIPEDKWEKVFEKGFTTRLKGEGTGMGLSLCKEIIKSQHYGKISISSVYKKKTTVDIVLRKKILKN